MNPNHNFKNGSTLNPKPWTPNPGAQTLNPKHIFNNDSESE